MNDIDNVSRPRVAPAGGLAALAPAMPAPSAGYLRLTGRILDAVADMAAKHGSPGSLDALYALRCRAAGHMVRELLPALLHGPWKRARHPRRSRYAPGTHLVDHAWRFTAGRGVEAHVVMPYP